MWQEWSHRPAQREPLNPLSAITLGSGARWRFSCPPVDRHHRGILHFELPVIKQCIKTSNQSTPTVPLSQHERSGGGGLTTPPHVNSALPLLLKQCHFHEVAFPNPSLRRLVCYENMRTALLSMWNCINICHSRRAVADIDAPKP